MPEGWGARSLLLLLPLLLGGQPERRNGLCLAKDDLARCFLQISDFSALEDGRQLCLFHKKWWDGNQRAGAGNGKDLQLVPARTTQLRTGKLSLKRTDGHHEVPATGLRESPGFVP